MRKVLFIAMAGLCILDSCKEEMIGQYPVDNIPPQNVSNVIVNNLPGKVELTYDLPNETDLLYVKAVYTDARGETQEVRTSVFNNKMTIPGFGKKIKRQIDLVAVDRSRNQSEPLYIDIEPEDSPIYAAAAQMSVRESWGGFVMKWKNEMREQFIVKTFKLGEDNKFSELETFYSTEEAPTYSVRGQESEPTTFGFVVEDVYGNSSDTTRVTLTPMYEVELPYSTFTYLPLAPGFTYRKSNNGMDKLFDNIYGASADFYIASGGAPNPYFSVDFGKEYVLSRIKVWQRRNGNYQFRLHCPRHIEIWGTSDPAAAADPANWEGWEKVASFESIRPSGLSSDIAPTAEDIEYANKGEDYEFPVDIMPMRYFRFYSVENWSKSTGLNFDELHIFGKAVE